jgi:hypothetical protein
MYTREAEKAKKIYEHLGARHDLGPRVEFHTIAVIAVIGKAGPRPGHENSYASSIPNSRQLRHIT